MMMKTVLAWTVAAVVVASMCGWTDGAALPSFAGGLPMATLEALVAAEMPAVSREAAKEIGVPASCCWDNVGEKTVHLCLQNQHIADVAVAGHLAGSGAGVAVAFSGSGTYESSYRLCAKEVIGGCNKLFGCDGSAVVKAVVDGSVPVALSVAADGHVVLASAGATGKVDVTQDTFCSKIAGEVSKTVAGLGPKVTAAVEKAAGTALATIGAKIPYKTTVADAVGIAWKFDAAGSELNAKVGIMLTGDAEVSDVKTSTPLPAPNTPTQALPSIEAALAASKAAFAFSDSVAANVAWAAWKAGLLTISLNKTVDGEHIVGSGHVTAPPQVTFGTMDTSGTDMVIQVNASVAGGVGPIVAYPTFDIAAGVNVTYDATAGGFVASVELVDFAVANVSAVLAPLIKGGVEKAFSELNAKLATMAINIPAVDGVTLKDPELSFVPGAALLVATPVVAPPTAPAPASLAARADDTIACPAIPGAHLDSCSVC